MILKLNEIEWIANDWKEGLAELGDSIQTTISNQ
jgi:hypothetical protein